MSSMSGASGPSWAIVGGAGALERRVHTIAAMPAAARAVASTIATTRRREERRGGRSGVGWERRVRGTRPTRENASAGEGSSCLLPRGSLRNYQSNLRPNRQSRGGTIVVGCRKLVAEPQLTFCTAFTFV